MKTKAILAALALSTAVTGLSVAPAAAQQSSGWQSRDSYGTYNRETFWRGAPEGLQQRIDWLQRRIERGVADGSLNRMEERRARIQLDTLRRDAAMLDRRLEDLSRSLRFARRDGDYREGGYTDDRRSDLSNYRTDYDATRYYRDDPRYTERYLTAEDEVYRGSDGRYYCKRSDGTTGLVIGGVGGAGVGALISGGSTAGTLVGGALGALLGRTVDRSQTDVRCR
jgi:hypothetical protein